MIKNFISKLLKTQHMGFALFVAVALVSCDKEGDVSTQEPELTPEELAEMAAADKFAAANSVYRALALINELPDNWEIATYTPAEGVPVDEANSDIRNVVSTGVEHAKSYFLSIVPDLGLEGDIWSHEGVGTLTFKAVNEDNCYAVIDVNLVQMPGLKQLRFVPESVVGENSFSGEPYYHVGDVVKDKKGIYWICVRPAGGPLKKDYAYFVSFDKSLIKTTTQNQTIYNVDHNYQLTKEKNTALTGKWTYAKNLVEERIAIAAAHTFAMFYGAKQRLRIYSDFVDKADHLNFPVHELVMNLVVNYDMDYDLKPEKNYESPNAFAVAYGSYVKNSYTKERQEKYLQPYLYVTHGEEVSVSGKIIEKVHKSWRSHSYDPRTPYTYSLTTDYDPQSLGTFSNRFYYLPQTQVEYLEDSNWGYQEPFNILDYTMSFDPIKGEEYFIPEKNRFAMNGVDNLRVLVMTQTSVKDNGKPNSGYTLIELEEECFEPDYWSSLDNTERRIYDYETSTDPVEDIYE